MLTFQTDIDEVTGEQVLTCFLLPQLEYQNEQQGTSHPASLSLSLLGVPIYFVDILIVLFHFPCAFYTSRFFRYVFVGCSFLFFTFYYFFLCVCVSYPFDVVVTEGAPALLRRWGGNGPIGWRANVSPWFHTPLFGSSFSIDDGFGTVGTKFLFFTHLHVEKFCASN